MSEHEDPDKDTDSGDEQGQRSSESGSMGSDDGATDAPPIGFRMPVGFSQSLLPTADFASRIIAPWQKQMQERVRSMLPEPSTYVRGILEPLNQRLQEQITSALSDMDEIALQVLGPFNERVREQMASITANLPSFSIPATDLSAIRDLAASPGMDALIQQITEQHARILEDFRSSLGPLFDTDALRGINRALLPPNLREHADEVHAHDVHEFVEQEGTPLYLVPRGRTALRLLRAKDRAARRRVLGDCYESLIEDCASVLENADQGAIGSEVKFALDGLGAMRAGHPHSAQAMFTVTLDTLISRFYPNKEARRSITNRKKGANVPDTIDEMGVREAFVWLPIWNAHEEFWKHKGDQVPHYYSRHASVHSVSSRQFSKRNCVQVLMLVTSLIGYAGQITAARRRTTA